MKLHVVEGPGGTRTLTIGSAEADRDFKAMLNTQEALHWVIYYPGSPQSILAKAWLKQNYGTDNAKTIRKQLAKANQPKKSWQDNPIAYALVIVTLTVSGSLLTKYLSDTITISKTGIIEIKPLTTPRVFNFQPEQDPAPEPKRRFRLLRWLHIGSDQP